MIVLNGTGVSSGIAYGKIRFFRHSKCAVEKISVSDTDREIKRWREAANDASSQLLEMAQRQEGGDAADLFETHRLMLRDPDFVEAIEKEIVESSVNAEAAIEVVGKRFSQMFSSMENDYMRERSADVDDVSNRLINILSGSSEQESGVPTSPVIIAADDLSPSETVLLDRSTILGFILINGSKNSHTAILARNLGIPAIIGIGEKLARELDGRYAVMDGSEGMAVIDPDERMMRELEKKRQNENAQKRRMEALRGKPDVTEDGKNIKVYANIASPADVKYVLENDAAGIGLFRSEFLFLESGSLPTEEQQFEAYSSVLKKMEGREVIIRTLDIGADKNAEYLGLERELNPELGMRGIRLCLTRPDIFKTQLRALYKASVYGKLLIMFPMVAGLWELIDAKRICREVREELHEKGVAFDENVPIGIMVETPAAALIADDLAKEADFFSVGTNDLTQYTLAADRQGSALERFYDIAHPAVMKLIEETIRAAHANGIWAGICGESAADTSLTEQFLKMGADEFSVSPKTVLPLRGAVRSGKAY